MSELLALVDGSAYSQSVCDHAAWAAGRLGSGVTVAHILGHRQGVKSDLSGNIGLGARTALLEELAELDKAKAQLAQKRGRAILEDAKARIEGQGVDRVETRLRNGDLVETLQSLEAEAQLVLVGKRGEAADFAKLHLGSNLERVARSTSRPLLVCAREFRPVRRAILAFDGATSAMKAVDHIARSPLLAETHITVLSAGADTTATRRQAEGAAAQLRGGGIAVDTVIEQGQPETLIARRVEAGEADMVVMGAFNHTRLRSFIIGSTTAEIVRSCQVPILLFR